MYKACISCSSCTSFSKVIITFIKNLIEYRVPRVRVLANFFFKFDI